MTVVSLCSVNFILMVPCECFIEFTVKSLAFVSGCVDSYCVQWQGCVCVRARDASVV